MKTFQIFQDVFNLCPFSQDTALLTMFSFGLEGGGHVSGFHLAFLIIIALTSQIRDQGVFRLPNISNSIMHSGPKQMTLVGLWTH